MRSLRLSLIFSLGALVGALHVSTPTFASNPFDFASCSKRIALMKLSFLAGNVPQFADFGIRPGAFTDEEMEIFADRWARLQILEEQMAVLKTQHKHISEIDDRLKLNRGKKKKESQLFRWVLKARRVQPSGPRSRLAVLNTYFDFDRSAIPTIKQFEALRWILPTQANVLGYQIVFHRGLLSLARPPTNRPTRGRGQIYAAANWAIDADEPSPAAQVLKRQPECEEGQIPPGSYLTHNPSLSYQRTSFSQYLPDAADFEWRQRAEALIKRKRLPATVLDFLAGYLRFTRYYQLPVTVNFEHLVYICEEW